MEFDQIIAVVISFNGGSDIVNTINALLNKVGHIYIIDNASEESTLNVLRRFEGLDGISITLLDENKGIGYALNLGVAKAKTLGYFWLLTMDQDSIIDNLMIEEYCNAIKANQNLICLSPNIDVFGRKLIMNGHPVLLVKELKYTITSGNLVRVDLFDKVGLYNEDLFIDCVDFDFSLRLRHAGYKIHQIESALMKHKLGEEHKVPSIIGRFYTSHSPIRRYYMYRNYLFIVENYILKFPFFILKTSIAHLLLLMIIPFYDKNPYQSMVSVCTGVRDYFLGRRGAYIKLK